MTKTIHAIVRNAPKIVPYFPEDALNWDDLTESEPTFLERLQLAFISETAIIAPKDLCGYSTDHKGTSVGIGSCKLLNGKVFNLRPRK